MQVFSSPAAIFCYLVGALTFARLDSSHAQDPFPKILKQPVAEPEPVAETPGASFTPSTELEKLDNTIRESAGKDQETIFERARLNESLRNRYRVIEDLQQFERLGGKHEDLHAMRAQYKMQTGEFAAALRDFQAGALLGNGPGDRHTMYVLALHFTGNSQLALTELQQAIKKEPENPGNYDLRGIIYRGQGKRAAALHDHDQSIKLLPDNPYGYLERACTNYAFGDYAAAKRDFEKSIQLGSADAYIYRYYAYFLATCGDEKYRDAQRALQLAGVALELDPNDGFALHAKACALALLGEYEVAVGAGLRARENREFANDPELGGGVEGKAYLAAWKQGKPLFRTADKEK